MSKSDSNRHRRIPIHALLLGLLVAVLVVGQPSLAGADPQTDPMPLETMDDGPTSGTLPNGTEWTVDNGSWVKMNPFQGTAHFWELPGTPGGTTTFTFDRPVDLRFGIDGLNAGAEFVHLPPGTVVESLHPSHSWDPGTHQLSLFGVIAGCGANPCVSTFTVEGVTSFAPASSGTNVNLGVSFMEVTADVPVVGVSMFNPWIVVPGLGVIAAAVAFGRRRLGSR